MVRFSSVLGICLRYVDDHVGQNASQGQRKNLKTMVDFVGQARIECKM